LFEIKKRRNLTTNFTNEDERRSTAEIAERNTENTEKGENQVKMLQALFNDYPYALRHRCP
jgi:hypothetical protein